MVKVEGEAAAEEGPQEDLADQIPCVPLVPGRDDNYAA